jgi:hypothetical protein
MTLLRGLGRFLYGLIIGDDWRITASVVASLVLGFLLLRTALPSAVVAVLIAVMLGGSFAAVVFAARRPRP